MSKRWGKLLLVGTHIAGWLPLIIMIVAWSTGNLTFNPIQAATIRSGRTAIIFLILSLAITPINTLFGLRQLIPLRRWLGLYTFLYATVHVSIFTGVDYGFNLVLLREAILEKPYAFVGAATFSILLPLDIAAPCPDFNQGLDATAEEELEAVASSCLSGWPPCHNSLCLGTESRHTHPDCGGYFDSSPTGIAYQSCSCLGKPIALSSQDTQKCVYIPR
jgi:hypothetical protein